MKSVVVTKLGGPEVLQVMEQPVPEPGLGQVRIRVAATSLNFADVKARQGQYHNAGQPPFVPGLDVAGIIDAVGTGVTSFVRGQRVIAFPSTGSYCEYTIAQEALTYLIPDALAWESAAALPTVGVTAYELLTKVTRLSPGESVLVHAAAGGIGTAALQLAKYLGAGRVIGTVGSDEKMAIAKEYGADVVINYRNGSFADRVLEVTDKNGVDVILDAVAGDAFPDNLKCLARFGRYVAFGNAGGRYGSVGTDELHGSCRSVLGYSMGTTRRYRPETLRPSVESVLSLAAEGRLTVPVCARYPLKEAAAAQTLLESRTSTGKIILVIEPFL